MQQHNRDVVVVTSVSEMQHIIKKSKAEGFSVGCVPTMGSLHNGHASLIAASASQNDLTLTSVFVNPTQFGPTEDFDAYPRNLDADIDVIAKHGGTHVFAPTVTEMYPDGFATTVLVGGVTEVLEGALRPGHFNGVATVVTKLLNAMMPDVAYFGQKDYQQTLVVKKLVRDLMMPVSICVMPTKRETNGLAMSSRNQYLSHSEQEKASVIFEALTTAAEIASTNNKNGVQTTALELEVAMRSIISSVSGFDIEYAVARDAETLAECPTIAPGDKLVLLVAARLGTTRLIDNLLLTA